MGSGVDVPGIEWAQSDALAIDGLRGVSKT
jgi:hypothetical protein